MFSSKNSKLQSGNNNDTSKNSTSQKGSEDDLKYISFNLNDNVEDIKEMLDHSSDLVIRPFSIGAQYRGALVFIDGLVDKTVITDSILKNVFYLRKQLDTVSDDNLLEKLKHDVIASNSIIQANTMDEIMLNVLSGDTALFIDGFAETLVIGTKGWESRSIEEPVSEAVVRGPREGFVENVRTNTVLLRRNIKDPNLRLEHFYIGRRAKKVAVLAYMEGIVNTKLIDEVRRRLKSIDIDDLNETGMIEQWIEDSFLSPFPQMEDTERPDKVAASLNQGRFAILLDGTPFALQGPITLSKTFQSPEDYYQRWIVSTIVRLLRYISAFIALFLPALYIALVSYHPGMIPSHLAFSITATREGVPVPAVMEALLMETTMEILREAGIRLPKPIGQTVGIVGGLVIGEAAVSAGIVSPIMVIVVALTAIATFTIPSYSMSIGIRFLRFGFMLAAATLGLFGIILAYIMVNIHIVNLKSFGVPYSTPFAPMFPSDWKDLLLRAPYTMNPTRPEFLQAEDVRRVNKGGNSQQ